MGAVASASAHSRTQRCESQGARGKAHSFSRYITSDHHRPSPPWKKNDEKTKQQKFSRRSVGAFRIESYCNTFPVNFLNSSPIELTIETSEPPGPPEVEHRRKLMV